MTTQEHLLKIKTKCQKLLTIWDNKKDHNPIYSACCGKQSEARWKATIAAIDGLLSMPPLDLRGRAIDNILTAWPIKLLD